MEWAEDDRPKLRLGIGFADNVEELLQLRDRHTVALVPPMIGVECEGQGGLKRSPTGPTFRWVLFPATFANRFDFRNASGRDRPKTSGLYEVIQYWYAAPHGADLDE